MPKKNVDYSNTIIYKICCKDECITDVYVGHTTNFIQRKYAHKQSCNNVDNTLKIYNVIRSNGGWDNWIMRPIEKFNGNDRGDALIREQYWIDTKKSDLNQVCAIDKNEIRRMKRKENDKKRKIKKFDNMIESVVSSFLKQLPEKNIDINELKSYVKKENNITWF